MCSTEVYRDLLKGQCDCVASTAVKGLSCVAAMKCLVMSYQAITVTGRVFHCHRVCRGLIPSHVCALQAELERDTESLKKEVVDIRLLAQRDIVLDPQAEMLEVNPLPHIAEHIRLCKARHRMSRFFSLVACNFLSVMCDHTSIQHPLHAVALPTGQS